MQVLTLIDLDDTLFQTRGKCPPDGPLHTAALSREGSALSFSTARQRALLGLLDPASTVVPVTARNLDAFRRVQLPFRSLAVLDFGAVILLPDGTPDPNWDAVVRPPLQSLAADLEKVRAELEGLNRRLNLGVRVRLIAEFDMGLYVVVKHPAADVSALDRLLEAYRPQLDEGLFFVHANDNNLSVVPRVLGKERAVEHLLQHHFPRPEWVSLGVGDSLTDAGFMRLCDFAMMPRRSQLFAHTLGMLEGH